MRSDFIKDQLNDEFMLTVNAHKFEQTPNCVAFRFSGSKQANLVEIVPSGRGAVDIEFFKIAGRSQRKVADMESVPIEQVEQVFMSYTGIQPRLSLEKSQEIPDEVRIVCRCGRCGDWMSRGWNFDEQSQAWNPARRHFPNCSHFDQERRYATAASSNVKLPS